MFRGNGWRSLTAGAVLVFLPVFSPAARCGVTELADTPSIDRVVDWGRGYLYAFGNGPVLQPEPAPPARLSEGLKTALADAREKLQELALAVWFDSSRSVADLLEAGETGRRAQKGLKRLVDGAEAIKIFYRQDSSIGLWLRAPLYGPAGLASITEKRSQEKEGKNSKADELTEEGQKPYLVLRVRNAPLPPMAAVWPAICLPGGTADKEVRLFDPLTLARDGLLPQGFTIYRLQPDELGPDLTRPSWEGNPSFVAAYQANGMDLVLEAMPSKTEGFLAPYKGLIILNEYSPYTSP